MKKTRPKSQLKLKPKASRKGATNQLRIIGGQWRGRKLAFADGEGLRPTMDRVRETLFNWLQADIAGARCLDLFTGSGALGLEALSRYASEVVMIDKNSQAIRMIRQNLELLKVENAQLIKMDARDYLSSFSQATAEGSLPQTTAEGSLPQTTAEGSKLPLFQRGIEGLALNNNVPQVPQKKFDIVFLDPPFNKQLVSMFCELLEQSNCLSERALVYIEIEKQTKLPELPDNWSVIKEKKAGQLAYYLLSVQHSGM